jgi:formylglycine-generating enzyme required for sulfatase activity
MPSPHRGVLHLAATIAVVADAKSTAPPLPQLRPIAGGEYQMGFSETPLPAGWGPAAAAFPLGDADERPFHNVTVSNFLLASTEVTNKQYEAFDPSHSAYRGRLNFSAGDEDAVIWVSWHDATAYCSWLTQTIGQFMQPPLTYRLPTEVEWEWAARGGNCTVDEVATQQAQADHRATSLYDWFPTGDSFPKVMWKRNDCNHGLPKPSDAPMNLTVASFAPNSCGLYDMAGNVEEWTADWCVSVLLVVWVLVDGCATRARTCARACILPRCEPARDCAERTVVYFRVCDVATAMDGRVHPRARCW